MAIQNTHTKIDIYVHADIVQKRANTTNEKSPNPNNPNNGDGNNDSGDNYFQMGSFKISKKRMGHMAVNITRTLKNVTTQISNSAIGQLSNVTGDTNYQAVVQRNFETATDVLNGVTNTALATASGFMIGGPLGAAFALASTSIQQGMSYAYKYENRNIQNSISSWKENQSVNYNKARAGVDLTDGRTRLR
jgi:hypothetical protein